MGTGQRGVVFALDSIVQADRNPAFEAFELVVELWVKEQQSRRFLREVIEAEGVWFDAKIVDGDDGGFQIDPFGPPSVLENDRLVFDAVRLAFDGLSCAQFDHERFARQQVNRFNVGPGAAGAEEDGAVLACLAQIVPQDGDGGLALGLNGYRFGSDFGDRAVETSAVFQSKCERRGARGLRGAAWRLGQGECGNREKGKESGETRAALDRAQPV